MKMRQYPPVRSDHAILPFDSRDFSWETFEEFFCAFLNAQPTLTIGARKPVQIKNARLYGKRGGQQNGIDIEAILEGEIWVFQCKRRVKWTKRQTEQAIEKCSYRGATHHFLLITCEVGEDSRAVIERHPDWSVWDGGQITQEFLKLKPQRVAGGILYRCFGPGWAEKFFGLRGDGPLQTADAFFQPWRDAEKDFNHTLELAGRKDWLERLDYFVRDRKSRVFLLSGKGGVGKSKLLLEWSNDFSRRNKGVILLFASRVSEDFEEHLRSSGERCVIVLDDAHQEHALRKRLFQAAARQKGIKLVLSLRPGPHEAINRELFDAGFDTSEVQEPPAMENLTDKESLQLAQEALGKEFANYTPFLYEASRDCPLVAVIGGALIRKGAVSPASLASHANIRSRVFESLRKQADAANNEFGKQSVEDLLAMIALLSPVPNTSEFRRTAATLLGQGWEEHRISRLIDRLDEDGVLLAGGSGLRITPDLLSDDIAYRACCDRHGKARGFSRKVIEHFSEHALETIARHLAEAEWRAGIDHEAKPEPILNPIVDSFRSKFLASSFADRGLLLDKWGQIAILRPLETLEFVDLAMRSDTAPAPSPIRSLGKIACEMDSFGGMLEHIPSLLRAVGRHHAEHAGAALDRLWALARERDDDDSRDQTHPLAAIADICKYEEWKPLEINKAALDWVERLLDGEEWLNVEAKPLVVMQVLLKPFLSAWIDKSFWMRRQAAFQVGAVRLDAVRELRERVLARSSLLLKRNNPLLAVGIAQLADEAASKLRPPFGGPPPHRLEVAWLPERTKALKLFEKILTSIRQPAVSLAIRKKLLHFLRYEDDEEFLSRCRELIGVIPNDLKMKALRAVFSRDDEEFDEPYHELDGDVRKVVSRTQQKWRQFLETTAAEIVAEFPAAQALAEFFDSVSGEGAVIGWEFPRFRELLSIILESNPGIAVDLMESSLSNPSHSLVADFDLLVHKTTAADLDRRLDLYRRAIKAGSPKLGSSAVSGLSWWRLESSLPKEAWSLLEAATESPSLEMQWAVVSFLDSHARTPERRAWQLLAKISFSENQAGLAARVLDVLGEMVRSNPQAKEVVFDVLENFIPFKSLDENRFHIEFSQIADLAPAEFFQLLVARYLAGKEGRFGSEYEALPFWIRDVPLGDLLESGCGEQIEKLSESLLAEDKPELALISLLRVAAFNSRGPTELILQGLLSRANSPGKLRRLMNLLNFSLAPLVSAHPLWAKQCLLNARQFGDDVYTEIRNILLSNCTSGGGGFVNGEPDDRTKSRVGILERLAHQYATEPELGSLFQEAASSERNWLESRKLEFLREMTES